MSPLRLTLLLLFSTCFLPAKEFEGTATYELEQDGATEQITFRIKGDRMAFESPGIPGGSVLIDRENREAQVIMPEEKMVLKMPFNRFVKSPAPGMEGTFEVTEEERLILGHESRKVLYRDQGSDMVLWITDEVGSFRPVQGPLADQIPVNLEKAFPGGVFVMEMQGTYERRPISLRVVRLREEALPDAAVQIPSDFQSVDIGGVPIPQGMQ